MPGPHQVGNLQRRSVELVIDATLYDIEMQVTFAELGILMTIASPILKKVDAKAASGTISGPCWSDTGTWRVPIPPSP